MKKGAATLDEPAAKALILEALTGAKVTIAPDQKRQFLIKSVSDKQRPRRPGAARSKRSGKADRKKCGDGARMKCFAAALPGCINATWHDSAGRVGAE
jgi:hypothetical protein